VLAAELDGKKLAALIDTGAANFAITRAAASQLGVTTSTVNTNFALDTTGIGNVTIKQLQHQFKSLSFGNETIREPLLGIMNTPVTAVDILLGQSFLFSRRFFISNATRTLFLGKAPAPPFNSTPSVLQPSPGQNGHSCKDGAPHGSAGTCPDTASPNPAEKIPTLAFTYRPSTVLRLPAKSNDENCKDSKFHRDSGDCVSAASTKSEQKNKR
jgi:hypothetical protein